MVNGVTSKCAIEKRRAGILIPQCPPANNLEINGEADYYFFAHASHEIYKATYDMLFDNNNTGH